MFSKIVPFNRLSLSALFSSTVLSPQAFPSTQALHPASGVATRVPTNTKAISLDTARCLILKFLITESFIFIIPPLLAHTLPQNLYFVNKI